VIGAVTYNATRHDDAAGSAINPTAVARYYDAKMARQEAVELEASALAARAAAQEKLQRFWERKEQKLDAMDQAVMPGPFSGDAVSSPIDTQLVTPTIRPTDPNAN
jgi:hypothetical protein